MQTHANDGVLTAAATHDMWSCAKHACSVSIAGVCDGTHCRDISMSTAGGMYAALRDAFDAAKRQLDDLARAQRGEVKHHEEARV